MTSRSSLRASDSDREQVVERLHAATTEGRLRTDELDQRVGAAFSARTYGELDALVADLPVPARHDRPRPSVPMWARGAIAVVLLLATLGALAGASHEPQFGPRMLDVPPQDRAQLFDGFHHAHHTVAAAPAILSLLFTLALAAALGWMFFKDSPAPDD